MAEIQNLVGAGKALVAEIDKLAGNIALYNLGKMVADDDSYDTLDYLERESKKSRLTYHAIHAPIHKRWVEWANDVEKTLFQTKGSKTELGRFRKLRDQVNSLYSKRNIDLPSISQKINEQVALVERVPAIISAVPSLPVSKSARRTKARRSRIERWITIVEKHPYYKLIIVLSGVLGFILVLLRLLAFL